MSHKSPTSMIVMALFGLMIVAALTPQLIALSHALLPLVLVVGIVVAIVRLVFFHTHH